MGGQKCEPNREVGWLAWPVDIAMFSRKVQGLEMGCAWEGEGTGWRVVWSWATTAELSEKGSEDGRRGDCWSKVQRGRGHGLEISVRLEEGKVILKGSNKKLTTGQNQYVSKY